jgi:CheY-like chemotaxis protein
VALVLAIEPDSRQAAILKKVIRERVHAELLIVDSRDAAVAALAARVPDVVLMTALLSPRDGDELIAYLRTLSGADHVQTHTIPQLASSRSEPEAPSGSGGWFRNKKKSSEPMAGCDPLAFADEVTTFLERAEEMKARGALNMSSQTPRAPIRASEFAADVAAAPAGHPDEPDAAAASWASPFEWRPADSSTDRTQRAARAVPVPPADSSTRLPLVTAAPLAVIAEEEELRLAEEALRQGQPDEQEERRLEQEAKRARALAETEAAAERERVQHEAEAAIKRQKQQRLEAEAAAKQEKLRVEAQAAAERERVRLEAEAAAKQAKLRVEAEAAAKREKLRLEAEAAAKREKLRLEAEAAAKREKLRLEAEAAAKREKLRLEAEAAAKREKLRLEAEAAAKREKLRLEAEAAAERERVRLEAEAAAKREKLRLEAEAAARREKLRLEAEAAAKREKLRLEAEAAERERERVRLEAEAAAKRERLRQEAEAAARRERLRVEMEAAAERERLRLETEAAAKRERERLEAAAAKERERVRLETEAAAKRERVRLEAEAAAERERLRLAAQAAAERDRLRLEADAAAERQRQRIAAEQEAAEIAAAARDRFEEFRPDADAENQSLLRLMPLSYWARREEPVRKVASAAPADDLRDLIDGLALPPQVAGVSYPSGCRIRRVRVPASPAPRVQGAPQVILSKQSLADKRAGR